MATRASGKRKRASHPPTAANSPAARRARGGGAAAAAEPPTLVEVEGKWAEAMQGTREKGQFLDVTLLAGQQKIAAHKTIIVSYSPYLEGLLTSGLAESAQAGDEVRVGDASTDGCAVEAIVDCFYSGKLALSTASVTAVIVAANMLQVGAIEKAANEFFVERLEPASAAEALGFSAQRVECGEAARELHEKCTAYVLEHFKECSGSGSLLQLPAEALVPLLGSDDAGRGQRGAGAGLRGGVGRAGRGGAAGGAEGPGAADPFPTALDGDAAEPWELATHRRDAGGCERRAACPGPAAGVPAGVQGERRGRSMPTAQAALQHARSDGLHLGPAVPGHLRIHEAGGRQQTAPGNWRELLQAHARHG
jgi:hypothetical protein